MESLRQPLEDGNLTISRAEWKVTFPADIQFVAAMNPCPCGYFASEDRECHCSKTKILQYLGRLSGPLLDRIDIQVMVNNPGISLLDESTITAENNKHFRQRIKECRKLQYDRQGKLNYKLDTKALLEYSVLEKRCKRTFNKAIKLYKLSLRTQQKVLRVARTIADLENKTEIEESAILEAISYRAADQLLNKARDFI